MKNKVIRFLQNLPKSPNEQFNQAFELYRQSEGKNTVAERMMNVSGYSETVLKNLLYDLQKLHGITDTEKIRVVESQTPEVESEAEVLQLDPSSEISGTQEETSSEELNSLKAENEDLQYEKEELEFENENLQGENESLIEELETLKLTPKIDAQAVRVEFPFLNEKDCPDELKILMADKITAWNNYIFLQGELSKIASGELVVLDDYRSSLAKQAIDAFDENQKIYDELNVYATTGKILGVHPIFKKLQLLREVDAMTTDELIKYKSSSAKYFSDNNKGLAKANKEKNTVKTEEITLRVADRKDKLFLVNKKLGV